MKIKMLESKTMLYGVLIKGYIYDTDEEVMLTVGQAKTFVINCYALEVKEDAIQEQSRPTKISKRKST